MSQSPEGATDDFYPAPPANPAHQLREMSQSPEGATDDFYSQ